MKYEVLIGFDTKEKRFEAGDILDEGDIPKKSKSWLVKENIIVKIDAKYKAKKLEEAEAEAKLVRARDEKGHFIADNPDTENYEKC